MRENVKTAPCVANRQAGQLMVAHQGAARSWHTCASRAVDKRVQCWGRNNSGQTDIPEGLRVFVPEDGQ